MVNFLSEQKKITHQELTQNNGKNGNPAYFAYQGKAVFGWKESTWVCMMQAKI
jgi:predicted heme/steroid binding protein